MTKKNYVLQMKSNDGRFLYATTDYGATVTEKLERAKLFTYEKAVNISLKHREFKVILKSDVVEYKSKITLVTKNQYTGKEEVVTIYDFSHIDHYYDGIKANYRIETDGRYHYYAKEDTRIIEIDIAR